MNSDYNQTKRHRGSSPPLQEVLRLEEFVKGIVPMSQQSVNSSEIIPDRQGQETGRSIDKKYSKDIHKDVDAAKRSADDALIQKDKNDEARWQDDGGEGG